VTAGGREFQVAGAALLKDCLPMSVRLTASLKTTCAAAAAAADDDDDDDDDDNIIFGLD